jgi:lactoylglutathione lyase
MNTPEWTQHLALKVQSVEEMLETKAKLEADGIHVLGPTDHTIFKSIYFFDPSGHRLELAVNTATPEMNKKLDDAKWDMLNEWAATKKAPQHTRWMHDGSHSAGDSGSHS